jgi:hypothetical protein
MNKENRKNILSKSIYWIMCSLIIILLFFLVFGILPVLIEELNLNLISVIGFIVGGTGAVIIIISLFSPASFMKHFMEKEPNNKSQYNKTALSFVYGLIGIFLLLGGLIYSFTGDSKYLVLCFMFPVILLAIFKKIMHR